MIWAVCLHKDISFSLLQQKRRLSFVICLFNLWAKNEREIQSIFDDTINTLSVRTCVHNMRECAPCVRSKKKRLKWIFLKCEIFFRNVLKLLLFSFSRNSSIFFFCNFPLFTMSYLSFLLCNLYADVSVQQSDVDDVIKMNDKKISHSLFCNAAAV